MAEYIEREKLKAAINEDAMNCLQSWDSSFASLVMIEIDDIPAADVAPVVHGHWILTDKWASKAQYKCSVCSRMMMGSLDANRVIGKYPYCHCGAKMQEVR